MEVFLKALIIPKLMCTVGGLLKASDMAIPRLSTARRLHFDMEAYMTQGDFVPEDPMTCIRALPMTCQAYHFSQISPPAEFPLVGPALGLLVGNWPLTSRARPSQHEAWSLVGAWVHLVLVNEGIL